MSEFTILGGPPSERSNRTDDHDAEPEPTRELPPGDPETATARGRLYSLLALGFARPDDDFERLLENGEYAAGLVDAATAVDGAVADAATAVEPPADTDQVTRQWASLFGVEEGRSVSPYELTYLPGPLLTTVRQLADIRGFYDAFGLDVGEAMPYRGDHVCYLTEFLGHCCLREARLRRRGDDEGVATVVDARGSFLEDHLGRWFWRFADEVSARDDGFYASLADLLAALVEDELETLSLEPEWVPDDPGVTEWSEDVFGDAGRGCGGCGADAAGLDEPTPGSQPNASSGDASLE
ncbi:anaerobic dehydrogenase subunit [Natronococcus amylolyticus DSM 10524]|uniref:Anaerobic dehydrogenase subunit n=1 Tax=Natronococcus amylolyticus DSM 10524 TaxID=1227497 RepID=L9X694_9EURY|nr:molecular chaperone TorD family protein [Natronococcus amylolyticus]ELY56098.1 anaerobic dehydrogenase subunit [Natronococcus amylolyticus DSM 10524]